MKVRPTPLARSASTLPRTRPSSCGLAGAHVVHAHGVSAVCASSKWAWARVRTLISMACLCCHRPGRSHQSAHRVARGARAWCVRRLCRHASGPGCAACLGRPEARGAPCVAHALHGPHCELGVALRYKHPFPSRPTAPGHPPAAAPAAAGARRRPPQSTPPSRASWRWPAPGGARAACSAQEADAGGVPPSLPARTTGVRPADVQGTARSASWAAIQEEASAALHPCVTGVLPSQLHPPPCPTPTCTASTVL